MPAWLDGRSRLDAASDSHTADRVERIEEGCAELVGLAPAMTWLWLAGP